MATVVQSTPEPGMTGLRPMLDAHWALSGRHVAACAWFCCLFLYFNYIPLFHSDLWGHVHYGQWMLAHGQLVVDDPFMPLARGMHAANNAWASQIVMAELYAWGGPHYLSNLFAVVVVGAYLIHARTFYLLTGRLSLAVLGTMLLMTIGWSRHAIIRPEIFGNLCFAILLWLLVSGRSAGARATNAAVRTDDQAFDQGVTLRMWIGIPLLMLAWVNLHGSFAVGLVTLGCYLVAVLVEEAWRTRDVVGLLQSRRLQHWALLTQLAVAATLINPYGLDMLLETWRFGKNPNLKDVLEWYPLKLVDMEGLAFGLSVVLLLAAMRWSRRRLRMVEVLLLSAFVLAMAPTIRMIAWYSPIFIFVWLPHAADAWTRFERRWGWWRSTSAPSPTDVEPSAEPNTSTGQPSLASRELRPAFRFAGTLVCGLMVWCAFAFAPISQPILGGKTRPLNRVHSRGTPLGITKYLREHPRNDLVFGPQWWGDWLAWDGPQGTQVFMTTHVHLAPPTVWRDYLRVARGITGWSQTLDRYAVGTLVIDKTLQPALANSLRGTDGWTVVYEDDQGIVAERKSPASRLAEPASAGSPS